ncbi:mediator of RNA polymerase II transcription subunit 9-like [Ruditapes philippinarum]|uniref:mediator of RNA polymerase II transcription subunit 9-like n=1 Tax=Ruditapes philippinarum TaxID=129788 RepID=UPI00295B3E5E|nr:mediator of RNA polymerase II transcription subunit 9-like [Ruditapes philippinarum]
MANVADNELNFLPYIYDIIKCIERDSRDVNQKMLDFRNQLLKARECVEKMPGIQYSRQDQLKQIDILQQQLTTKTQLIHKYKSMHTFDLAGQTPMQQ